MFPPHVNSKKEMIIIVILDKNRCHCARASDIVIGCHKYVMWRVKDLLKRSVEDTLNNIYLLKEGRLLERLSE